MPRWSPQDIDWDSFDKGKLVDEHLKLVKAAGLTEFNAAVYTRYLKNVFSGDQKFAREIEGWQEEEEQHGRVLGRYAELADPAFDFAAVFARFREGYAIPVEVSRSVRGSRVGELIARCMVETGTSSFYTALSEASDEPVLKAICRHIAADEFRHYRMFLDGVGRYRPVDGIWLPHRIKVAVERIREIDDDELSFAYHCSNEPGQAYDRQRCNRAYGRLAYRLYRQHHAERAVAMVFKAVGLSSRGWLGRWASTWTWAWMQARATAQTAM
jgi:rubrerythrin